MPKLDIYICTKSKCTAKCVQIKLRETDPIAGAYNGPALLDAVRHLVDEQHLGGTVAVHEVACMSGCPVGPRIDIYVGSRRVMYFQRKTATGRPDLISWITVTDVETEIKRYLEYS